ncbi:hypothetical protein AMK59_740 [Oryctes borbonicus]|uniref:Integrase zinc-binding domain-containing protein n=1 Tax=Oryctes borbonicus TaxID=1629725 RepID=A0A0T6BA58_9SCAR|nr:hypothetical protein AMK59_740 [Oryctes borbonicus]
MKVLVKLSQQESFSEELCSLRQQTNINGNVVKLSPFLDEEGYLRVGGGLTNSNFNNNKKYPLLISGKHILAKLILEYEHNRLRHAGPQYTLSSVSDHYWITGAGGRNLISSVMYKCVRFKVKPVIAKQIMDNSPKHRTGNVHSFYAAGTDCAGLFLPKERSGRAAKTTKCYICIFICFSTKAIHLEPVGDLITKTFIAISRRFVSRRGLPNHICLDNWKISKIRINGFGKIFTQKSINSK